MPISEDNQALNVGSSPDKDQLRIHATFAKVSKTPKADFIDWITTLREFGVGKILSIIKNNERIPGEIYPAMQSLACCMMSIGFGEQVAKLGETEVVGYIQKLAGHQSTSVESLLSTTIRLIIHRRRAESLKRNKWEWRVEEHKGQVKHQLTEGKWQSAKEICANGGSRGCEVLETIFRDLSLYDCNESLGQAVLEQPTPCELGRVEMMESLFQNVAFVTIKPLFSESYQDLNKMLCRYLEGGQPITLDGVISSRPPKTYSSSEREVSQLEPVVRQEGRPDKTEGQTEPVVRREGRPLEVSQPKTRARLRAVWKRLF